MMVAQLTKLVFRNYHGTAKQVVVISGCDTGLGFSLAGSCLQKGLTVVAGCLKSKSEGAMFLKKHGARVVELDVTKESVVYNFSKEVQELLREDKSYYLQAVVNNAGIMIFGEFEWQTHKQMQSQIAVNLTGSFNMALAFLPLLQQRKGRLINIASHCSLVGLPGLSVYGATKAAILNWSETLRIEQEKYGVRVISFIPGSFFGESGIMANQAEYASEMLKEMSTEKKSRHINYFYNFQRYLEMLPRSGSPQKLQDSKLNKKLLHAVLSPNPKITYKHEPLRYKIYHTLFKLSPRYFRDRLIQRFVSLPKYKNE